MFIYSSAMSRVRYIHVLDVVAIHIRCSSYPHIYIYIYIYISDVLDVVVPY